MPSKKPPMTHTGVVITKDGRKRVQLRMTPTTWCTEKGRWYFRTDGRRGGHAASRARLLLDTIKPLEVGND
jgi:hypothetical protein